MANIKSQIKRNRQNENRRLRNRNMRGAARTAVNQARAAFEANEPETKEAITWLWDAIYTHKVGAPPPAAPRGRETPPQPVLPLV